MQTKIYLRTVLGALAIGSAALSPTNVSAEPGAGSGLLPSEDFMMSATYCPDSASFSACAGNTVDGGYWLFNSDASVSKVSGGVQSPDQGTWSEVQPGQISVEFRNQEGLWLSSILADRVSGGEGGEYPCFEGLVEDLDIAVLSVRLCLEP